MDTRWQPPPSPQLPPPLMDPRLAPRPSRLPAAIVGSAILVTIGLVVGALILRDKGDATADGSTCQAWTQTRSALRAVPPLPDGWTWETPNIDALVKFQNGPVGYALDQFAPHIAPQPADVAQAATEYVAARRNQMKSLANRTYQPADGAAVDEALNQLNKLCGIPGSSQPA